MARGKYLFGERVSADAIAEVFRATVVGVEGFERPVTIQRLSAHDSERVIALANAAAGLQHPNLVGVLDIDHDEDGRLFLATEQADGLDLGSVLARGPLPVPVAVYIASEILRGLAHSHELGVVHGDVTRDTVRLDWRGSVKVFDLVVGQLRATIAGRDCERLDDLNATGALLAEMLPKRIDADVRRVRDRLLARDPAVAYPTAQQAVSDLDVCASYPPAGRDLVIAMLRKRAPPHDQHRIGAVPVRKRWRRGSNVVAIALGVVAVVGTIAWVLLNPDARPDARRIDARPRLDEDRDRDLNMAAFSILLDEIEQRVPRCTQGDAQGATPDGKEYRVAAKIGPTGKLTSLVITPQTTFTVCLTSGLDELRFPSSTDGFEVAFDLPVD